MRYRETILQKLERMDNLINKVNIHSNRNERRNLEETLREMKDLNNDIFSYINREPVTAEELALKR